MPTCKRVLVLAVLVVSFAVAALAVNSSNPDSPAASSQWDTGSDYFTVSPSVSAPGQFVNFSWHIANADSFSVTPSMLSEDEEVLPISASRHVQVAPLDSTVFTGIGSRGQQGAVTVRVALTIVPVTINISTHNVAAGRSVVINFSGPNNGSSFFLTILPENVTIPLTPDSCVGSRCTGSYMTGPLGSSKTFMVGATGPQQGQAYSQPVSVSVTGGMSLSCTATPVVPASGQPVTIHWAAANAVSVHIDQGIGEVSPATLGSVTVRPTATTTYTCTATDRFGNHLSAPTKVILSNGSVSNLNHIVYLLQENRAFDNYFGNLAYYRVNVDHISGAQLSDVNDLHNLPPGYTIQNSQGQSFPPFHARTECTEGLAAGWNDIHKDMDLVGNDWLHLSGSSQYLMDNFLKTVTQNQYDPTDTHPLGYYDWTDLPFYYELASQFNTSDTWYAPVPDSTIINRMYLFAGTSFGPIFTPPLSSIAWKRPTIFRVLTDAGVSWRYYYQDNSVFLSDWQDWNNPQIQANVRNIQEWYNILASPTADQDLPQVVFIERASATGYDEHPGNNIQKGAARVQQIMTPLFTSAAWPDSVFILSYDEGGGTFDHQAPILLRPPDDQVPWPIQNQPSIRGLFNVAGLRLPVILVSPWSKPHFVWHQPTDFTSILKLIETRFNLPPLTGRDRTAADLTDPQNGPFDFSTPQMLQVPPLPTQPTNGTCNYQLEGYPN